MNSPLKEMDGYELSPNQKNLWLTANGNIEGFYSQVNLKLKKSHSINQIKNVVSAVLKKHEVLQYRARITPGNIYPEQVPFVSDIIELSEGSIENEDLLENQANANLGLPYNFSENAPIRFAYINGPNEMAYLVMRGYSFWLDAYSMDYIIKEIESGLSDIEKYNKQEVEKIDFLNFSAWQNELANEPEEEAKQFWEEKKTIKNPVKLPFGKRAEKLFQPEERTLSIKGEEFRQLKSDLNSKNIDLETWAKTQFVNYLNIFEGDSIKIGFIPFERSYDELSHTVGNVSRAIPLVLDKHATRDKLELVQEETEAALTWADYFQVAPEILSDKGRTFDYLFEFIPALNKATDQNSIEIMDWEGCSEAFEVKIKCEEFEEHVSIQLIVNKAVFSPSTITLMENQLFHIYTAFVSKLGTSEISDYEEQMLSEINDTQIQYKENNSILALFDHAVLKNPQETAVYHQDLVMNYTELNAKANQFAHCLINKYSVGKGDRVIVLMDRSEHFIISVLGILKTGACYVPIDTKNPVERIQLIIDDASPKLIITEMGSDELNAQSVAILSPISKEIYEESDVQLATSIQAEDKAYMIYTSGSTGKPKGCQISHANLLNYIQWTNEAYFESENTGDWALITSIAFDLTITCIFSSLTRGRKLWIGAPEKDINDLLVEVFENPEINTLKLTPSHIDLSKNLSLNSPTIDTVICGGEQLTKEQVRFLKSINPEVHIFNEYGPTEATVGCVVTEVEEGEEILVGKPIGNSQIHVFDSNMKHVRIGAVGEIGIVGKGVIQEYFNRPELTADRFIKNPFELSGNLYKTGDLGRWLPNGQLEFLGRKDDQVKIRGYRIELGEVQHAFEQVEELSNSIVTVERGQHDEAFLYAYVVTQNEISVEKIKLRLLKSLPDYMIPNQIIFVDQIPLTVNGKVDKRLLTEWREKQATRKAFVAPTNAIEDNICTIWKELFEIDQIGIKDDFFELGGHSLTATRLIGEYHKVFNVKLKLKDFFNHSTAEAHAKLIAEHDSTAEHSIINPTQEQSSYPLSDAQTRVWMSCLFDAKSVAYNMPNVIHLNYALDVACFEKAIVSTIERHESLRTVFKADENNSPKQFIVPLERFDFKLGVRDLSETENSTSIISQEVQQDTRKSFDLENGPLIRAVLYKVAEDKFVFYFNLHHIISDGWSMNILGDDVLSFYRSYLSDEPIDLLPLRIQYKDYAVWEKEQFNNEGFNNDKRYWTNQFENTINPLELSFSKTRPQLKTGEGKFLKWNLSDAQFNTVKNNAGDNTSPYMKVLSALSILVYRHSHQTEFVIGSPSTGRQHDELKNQIGFYLNTIALKLKIDLSQSFQEHINEVKKVVFDAHEHQNYPFDKLIEELNLGKDLSRGPLFDTMLVMNQNDAESEKNRQEDFDHAILAKSKFDFTVYFNLALNMASFHILYNKDLFEEEDMQQFGDELMILLTSLGHASEVTLKEMVENITPESETVEQKAFEQEVNTILDEDF
ncbi:MAG: amino acid adenylation domain-containing protein [Crocinitomix sp.]|nr:amino acid adenylation domain-containing protein [Crocinitomix sp.]